MNKATQSVESAAASGAFHIENVYPLIDGGRFAVKRIVGERVEVWADLYRDGQDVVCAALVWRLEHGRQWRREPMALHGDDRWTGSFVPDAPGRYVYAIEAWTDQFGTWRQRFERKLHAGGDVTLDALEGAGLLSKAPAEGKPADIIIKYCENYLQTGEAIPLLNPELRDAMAVSQARPDLTRSPLFPLAADRPRARNGAWYAMVPRSQGRASGQHGTFADCIARLPDIAAMGFDVVCVTPIQPIGHTDRKGHHKAETATESDPGNYYAVGAAEGGHDAIHPELGTLDDFREFVASCRAHNMEVALDFAVQFSPDHPWLKQHPQWFKRRPDGSVRFAENAQVNRDDVVAPDFASQDAGGLWNALRDVLLFWTEQGVSIFRIENPHHQLFQLWEWLIQQVQRRHPETIFLAGAFTRPKLMKGLAELGFTQSCTYFPWKTRKWELEQYLNELTAFPQRDYFRPNFFVSTPDILPYHLQSGESWAFKSRAALAATLSSSYGIVNGFELLEHEPVPGKEEYRCPERYQIRVRDWDRLGNIKPYIAELNRIRRENAGLQQTSQLRFIAVEDDGVIAFAKESVNQTNTVVSVIALSPGIHEFWLVLGHIQVGVEGDRRHVSAVENLITGERSQLDWGGIGLRIDPAQDPALLFRCLA